MVTVARLLAGSATQGCSAPESHSRFEHNHFERSHFGSVHSSSSYRWARRSHLAAHSGYWPCAEHYCNFRRPGSDSNCYKSRCPGSMLWYWPVHFFQTDSMSLAPILASEQNHPLDNCLEWANRPKRRSKRAAKPCSRELDSRRSAWSKSSEDNSSSVRSL